MKINYQSAAQKRQTKRRKIAARNSRRLSSWPTRPETNRADEHDVSIRETESTPQLVDVSIRETENSDATKDRSDASKNDDFPTIIVNSEIKKSIIAAGPKQPEGTFPKDPLQSGRSFSTNYYNSVTQSSLKLQRYWLCYSSNMDRLYCQPCCLFSHENVSPGTSYALQSPWSTTGLNDWRYLSQRIRNHESSTNHAEACVIYEQWRNRWDNRRSFARVFAGKNKLLTKCFGKTSECYIDVSKVQLTFSRIQ